MTSFAAGTIHIVNRLIDATADIKNVLKSENGNTFDWKNGKIFYTKHGEGSPVLLLHDLNPQSSSIEWTKIVKKLEKNHTVYSIDLLGCGRSEKPCFTYTNYLYVQLVTDFINCVIGEKTDIIATGDSSSFAIFASNMNPDIIGKIIAINPTDLKSYEVTTDKSTSIRKVLLELPIIGTFIYNVKMSNTNLTNVFKEKYFEKHQLVSSKIIDAYYESAHMKGSSGKYLLASMEGNYTKNSLTHALEKLENPLYLIQSKSGANFVNKIDAYTRIVKDAEVSYISNTKHLPQLEAPDKLYAILKMFLDS